MKRIVSALLLLALLLCFCACDGSEKEPPKPKVLQVGFGRTDITPQLSVPLAGYGNTDKRMSLVARDNLYATCVAITDEEGETLLLVSQDLINSSWYKEAQSAICEATDVPAEHIMIAATHTHSAPDQTSPLECIQQYKQYYLQKMAEAAMAAMADRSEAYTYTGQTKLEKMNGVRHYLMADGTYAGDNFGSFKDNAIVEPAEEKDNDLQVIRFAREGKQDVVMVNWQAHPSKLGSSTSYLISADFVGDARTAFEESTGQLFVYFTGAAGNQNPSSKLESQCFSYSCQQYGQALAEAAAALLEKMDTPAITSVKAARKIYTGQVNHDMEDKLEQARQVQKVSEEEGSEAANLLAKQYGFAHRFHATAVIRRREYEESRDFEVSAASLGAVSFVSAPYEMFSVHGSYIKDNSPADMTFVISCCNGNNGYLPSNKAYDYNCYEAYNSNFARGTGDQVAELLVDMLNQLK